MTRKPLSTHFELALPGWTLELIESLPDLCFPELEARLGLVVHLSRLNFENDTGGPFAAAVFEEQSGRLISVGVNRVVPEHCSSAHAEIMALSLAQRALDTFDLGGPGLVAHQLVVNWRPCAMCFGAIPWSGVRSLAVAGSGEELERLTGFDEGPIHPDWVSELERRGIRVSQGALREPALAVFEQFTASGRLVYNARRGSG